MEIQIKDSSLNEEALANRDTALIIGVSINNSYFKDENLIRLISWASKRSNSVYIMIPDEPAVHTMMALGYTEKEAERKSKKKSNALENKCNQIIESLDVATSVRVLRWKNFNSNIYYTEALFDLRNAYQSDENFMNAVRTTTIEVLLSNGVLAPSGEAVEIGIQFLLKELAFISHADRIFEKEKMAYVYHRDICIIRYILSDFYDFKFSRGFGFITAI
ncbi:MAG: tRNA-dependent cyclodipeptide synthase [Candidatus Nomurabacteria bacterium]|nr:tRNA-dependent cyclodipeptide synthase [Candidatus Nomurabacteria bacterium]